MCNDNKPVETIANGRYRIDIFNDFDASNPFEDRDGCVPIMVEGGRDYGTHDYGNVESTILSGLNNLDEEQLIAIADKLDGGDTMKEDAAADVEGYPGVKYSAALCEKITEAMPASGMRKLEYLEAIADTLGYPCITRVSRGYCQGDRVDVLAVWLPAFGAENRPDATPEDVTKELKSAVELYSSWAWGDVFGYTITDTLAGEEVDACWGFYGRNFDESGLMEEATSAAEYAEQTEKKRHFQRLKRWIKAHVPLTVREPFQYA